MKLDLSPEYEAFRQDVNRILTENAHLAPTPDDKGFKNPKRLAWQKLLIEHGLTARTIPKEYGGSGAEPDLLKSRIIAEEFARTGIARPLSGQGIAMLVPTLLELGTPEQKEKYIRPTLHGEMIWCQGYSEPGSGSDLASLRTSAVEDGDGGGLGAAVAHGRFHAQGGVDVVRVGQAVGDDGAFEGNDGLAGG